MPGQFTPATTPEGPRVSPDATAVKIELDADLLSYQIAEQVAERLASLFPSEAAEFWSALCDQAYRERHRLAGLINLHCSNQDQCPHLADVLSGIRFEGRPG